MEIFVGTSGWSYDWNDEGNLSWYAKNSGLWTIKGKNLRWIIKVNQLITHKFSEKAFNLWKRFGNLFKPLDDLIDFYPFQLPPIISPKYSKRLEEFIKECKLGERFALEARNVEWFTDEWIKWASGLGIALVSVDSPEHPRKIFSSNEIVYVRMHGGQFWYSHYYED